MLWVAIALLLTCSVMFIMAFTERRWLYCILASIMFIVALTLVCV